MEALIFFLIVFSSITLWKHMGHRHRERMLGLQRGRSESVGQWKALRTETEERLRHLESIVCNVDFELNAKLNRIASAQPRALAEGDGAPGAGGELSTRGSTGIGFDSGQRVSDRFVIERALGEGGMARVYLARDEKLGGSVALKVIHGLGALTPAAVERLRGEARAARRIAHPNVVRTYDIGEDKGQMFLSMEYVSGSSLAELLDQQGPMSVEQVHDIMQQICLGLEAAHSQGVIHRDLKPANVIVQLQNGRSVVKIIDFGVARLPHLEGMTATGMLLGTPEYMAPEQLRDARVDVRADVYAAGALAYHALTGQPPFSGPTPIAVSLKVSTEDPTPIKDLRPDVPQPWVDVIAQALAKDPTKRYQSARELAAALPAVSVS